MKVVVTLLLTVLVSFSLSNLWFFDVYSSSFLSYTKKNIWLCSSSVGEQFALCFVPWMLVVRMLGRVKCCFGLKIAVFAVFES